MIENNDLQSLKYWLSLQDMYRCLQNSEIKLSDTTNMGTPSQCLAHGK
jgi:hypothetical protein